jgi:hypothetical protein
VKIKIPLSLITVTLFSKILAGILFFTFIILGFFAGMKYQGTIDLIKYQQSNLITTKPSPTPNPTANWKTYTYPGNAFTIQYPSNWIASQGFLNGGATGLSLSGPEGNVGISENVIFSGTCDQPNPLLSPLQIYHEILYGCYSSNPNGSIGWDRYVKIVSPTMKYGIQAIAASPGEKNRNTILQMLSALRFTNQNQVACTMEAKLCPDGKTSVGRIGPNCEFAPCPTTSTNPEGKFCGGIAGKLCPTGYECQYEGNYPDAGGKCVKQ